MKTVHWTVKDKHLANIMPIMWLHKQLAEKMPPVNASSMEQDSCIRGERRTGEMNIKTQPAEGIEEQSRKQSQAEMSEACKGWRETEEDKTAFRNSAAIQHKKKEKQKLTSPVFTPPHSQLAWMSLDRSHHLYHKTSDP